MRVTIKDIARETGYSKTTVSFAFNDPDQIAASTRDKILETATRLGYVPDPVARSLSRRTMGTIGLLLPQTIQFALHNPYMVDLISGIGEACDESDLSLTMIPPRRGSLASSVRSAAVDGLITIGLEPDDEAVQLIRNRHVPFVTIDSQPHATVPSVLIDDAGGAKLAMGHLIQKGHRSIAVVTLKDNRGPDEPEYAGIGILRMRGYKSAVEEAGIGPADETIVRLDEPCSFEGGEHAARVIAHEYPDVTAIAVMSDIQALGVQRALVSHGVRVPQDVSVIGFDGIREADLVGLTTVRQPSREKGRKAGDLLVRIIGGENVEERVQLSCELIERTTVSDRSVGRE